MANERWYKELVNGDYGLVIRVDRELHKRQTEFQEIEIFENKSLGRIMTLDGLMMITERHEFTYHEMLVHPALFAHPKPERVLVIGGGDGGTLREVVKHPEVKEAVLCEIDGGVIEVSKEYLPFVACGFDSPKVQTIVGDGVAYVKNHENYFDVLLVDSTDPVGPAEGLFQKPFYLDCQKALRPGGIFVQQSESPFFDLAVWQNVRAELEKSFKGVFSYAAAIPMYPSGFWTFAFASNDTDPWTNFDPKRAEQMKDLLYYTPELQTKAFAVPAFATAKRS